MTTPPAPSGSVRGKLIVRGALALALLVGFYAMALGLAGAMLYLVYLLVVVANRINLKIIVVLVGGAGAILWGIVPRVDRFDPPGPRLVPERQPRLFALLRRIADACGQSMPAEVYLVGNVNAFVTQRGGVMGVGSRRVMGLGLPLLRVLPVSELRAVIAHEFGHYHGGDVALGPWIYKTRGAIGRTLATLAKAGSAVLYKPFQWYATLFLRLTMSLSRQQEIDADALAARVAGASAAKSALKRVAGAAMAFDAYVRTELEPVLGAGFRPPVADGFARFVSAGELAAKIDAAVAESLAGEKADAYDSHPALPDRVRAIDALASEDIAPSPEDERPAIELVDDLAALEAELLTFLLVDREKAATLTPLAWEQVGSQVYAANWKQRAAAHAQHFEGLRAATAPLDRAAMAAWARVAAGRAGRDASDEDIADWGAGLVASALAAKMVDAGWTATTMPGESVVLERDGQRFDPFELVKVVRGEVTAERWRQACADAGVVALSLAPDAPEEAIAGA